MTDGERLTIINTQHEKVVTYFVANGDPSQLLLQANPRRFYVRFFPVGGGGMPIPIPAPIPPTLTSTGITTESVHYKFDDCPAVVTGEFYIAGPFLGSQFLIIEDIYVGR